jgi:hypothetical protein
MPEVHAVLAVGVRSQPTSDGQMGLLRFQRSRPDRDGSRELNVAVPAALLPYVAAAALEAVPQSAPGTDGPQPMTAPARSAQLGLGPEGAIVLTVEMDMGARVSFAIDLDQAERLHQTMSIALGRRMAQGFRAAAAAARSPPKP